MSVVKQNQVWAIKKESSEGTYVAPASANDYIQITQDGSELSRSKEVIERNIFSGGLGSVKPRVGMFNVTGSIGVEARAGASEGSAPEYDVLMESTLGEKRTKSTVTSDDTTHTNSRIYVTGHSYIVGDVVMIKEAGAYHVSPISAIASGYIDLAIPAETAFSNQVVVAAFTQYKAANSGHSSLSISRWLEGEILQQATGCKVSGLSIDGFSTGKLASFKFSFQGMDFDSSLTEQPHTPSYQQTLPPILLDARAFMDGALVHINELSLSVENSLAFQTSINAPNGRLGSRITKRNVSGSFNPFMSDSSLSNFEKFKNNDSFSVFAYAKLPSNTGGEFGSVVAIYMPSCSITELSETDQEGILQDSISFNAQSLNGAPELYITVI